MDEYSLNISEEKICNRLESMIQSMIKSNLENYINEKPSFSLQQEKGEDNMASRFREKVKIGTSSDGTPQYAWASGNTKDELFASIARLLSGNSKEETRPHEILWEDYADMWFDVFHKPNISVKALSKDQSLMKNHVRPAFVGVPIKSITATMVQSYLETKSNYCKAIVRDIMSIMRNVFDLAVDNNILSKNPMRSRQVFNPSKKPDKTRNALTPKDQADIIRHIDDLRLVKDRYGDSMNAVRFMAFLMFTPMRPCEIFGLRWEDINASSCTINICRDLVFDRGKGILGKTKTESSKRQIPFDPVLLEYISPIQQSGFVIHMTQRGREDEHFTEQAATNMWNRIKKHIDVHGMTPYMGRHTFATNMSRSGVPIKTAMAMMGHSDERMLLRRYTHVNSDDLLEASKIVATYTSNLLAVDP